MNRTRNGKYIGLAASALAITGCGKAQEQRPNILWLTFEDASWYHFGCYGNRDVHTPVTDSLAAQGVVFTNAWASAPQSSPSRSSLITGCLATSYGMDLHPRAFDTPDGIFFPQLLRDAGYWCTNNNKTHYNTTRDNKSCWDECSRKASYKSPERKPGQPFFAVYNAVTSHMGRCRTFHTEGRRDYSAEGICIDSLTLPPHLPDLPEVRSDYAANLEAIQDIDRWVGIFLEDLKESGEADNTIIFVFSDHGGCQPRGKGLIYETGLRVPMIAYFPEKYRHLYGKELPGRDGRLVNFTDLGPTVLSLAGVKPPKGMQGRALMGEYAAKKDKIIDFAFNTNQLHHFMPMRAARDARYKYIRCYIPYRQMALRNYYQWGMPANQAWDAMILAGGGIDPVFRQPYERHPAEQIFDLREDIYEIRDLSGEATLAKEMRKLAAATSEHIRESVDLGFFLPTTRERRNLYEYVRENRYPLKEFYNLVELAGKAEKKDIDLLCGYLASSYPDFRFWAVVGLATIAINGDLPQAPAALPALMQDSDPYVAAEAALASAYAGHTAEAVHALATKGGENDRKVFFSALECLALDSAMKDAILGEKAVLEDAAQNLPRTENEDAGLMARGILVDIGCMDIGDLYGPEAREKGLKLNKGRRKIAPLP